MDPYQVLQLIERYNQNPDRYTDEEAEIIAELAKGMGSRFKRTGKPLQKALFDLADTATFGLLPNSARPTTRGDSVYGDTGEEELLSLFGMLGGGVIGGAGAVRGARGIMNMFRKSSPPFFSDQLRLPGSVQYGRYGTPSRKDMTQFLYDNAARPDINRLNLLQITSGQRLLPGQTRGQIRRNRLPLDSTSGQPIAMRSSRRSASPTDAATTYSDLITQYDLASPRNTRQQYIENLVNDYFGSL